MDPEQRLLYDVLCFGHAAQHPVGDGERHRSELVEQSLAGGHAANPCRQVGWAGCHPSWRLALAFDAPRNSFIIATPAVPAKMRPTQRGTRIGLLAPSSSASAGSHSATVAGSSSTTL